MNGRRRKRCTALLLLLPLLLLTLFAACMTGPAGPIGARSDAPNPVPAQAVGDILTGKRDLWPAEFGNIVVETRLLRALFALLVGMALAASGTAMQGLFRNPLADPYLLGLSAGGALGAAVSLLLPGTGVHATALLSFLGASGAVFAVYGVARVGGGRIHVETLLLAGIALTALFSAVLGLLYYIYPMRLQSLFFWFLGSLATPGWEVIYILAPLVLAAVAALLLLSRDLNHLLLGEEEAHSMGVNVEAVKRVVLLLSSLLAGLAVAFAGLIGFVGLVIPHISRLIVGPDHRLLIPASVLAGGVFLTFTDLLARSAAPGLELPVGAITALAGVPFFLYLLVRKRVVLRP